MYICSGVALIAESTTSHVNSECDFIFPSSSRDVISCKILLLGVSVQLFKCFYEYSELGGGNANTTA